MESSWTSEDGKQKVSRLYVTSKTPGHIPATEIQLEFDSVEAGEHYPIMHVFPEEDVGTIIKLLRKSQTLEDAEEVELNYIKPADPYFYLAIEPTRWKWTFVRGTAGRWFEFWLSFGPIHIHAII